MTDRADDTPAAPLPLHGRTVVDLTTGLAGPVATRLLVDAGARVIKLEQPDGDWTRHCLPAAFATWNRGKEGARLNVEDTQERARLAELLDRSDVVVHGWSQSEAKQYGLDDASLAQTHPRLIAASVTGYPDHHRDAGRSGHEILVQARLGAMDEQQGLQPGPNFVRLPFASWTAAYLLAGGILTRLIERATTGAAHAIHTSILQGALAPAALYWQRAERPPDWMARHTLRRDDHPSNLTIFQCSDGRWLHALGGFGAAEVVRDVLTEAGCPELFGRPVTLETQQQWREVFARRSVPQWLDLFWPAGVIAMPILDVGEILNYEQARANGYAISVADERFGSTTQAGAPITFPASAAPVARSAPWSLNELTDLALPSRPESSAEDVRPMSTGESPALAQFRVLDFGAYVAGPYGGQCAADLGADVIKVEPPWGERGRTINQFTGCQRGKRSLAIDLQRPEAAEVLRRLLASADLVMHNVREGAAGRLGIDDAGVHAANPSVVYAHSSAWGVAGPWAGFAAFDPAACAVSGWTMELTAPQDPPMWLRNSTMDTDTGLSLFLAGLLGLYSRLATGRGATVRTSMLGVAALSASEVLYVDDEQRLTPVTSIDHEQTGVSPYYRIYRLIDGWIAVAATSAAEQKALLAVAGAESAVGLEQCLAGATVEVILSALDAAGVPAEPVARDNRDPFFDRELVDSSGLVMRGLTRDYGWFENPAGFWSDGQHSIRSKRPIPSVGEHSEEILAELGFSSEEIAELVATQVVSTERIDPPSGRVFNVITKSLAIHPD